MEFIFSAHVSNIQHVCKGITFVGTRCKRALAMGTSGYQGKILGAIVANKR